MVRKAQPGLRRLSLPPSEQYVKEFPTLVDTALHSVNCCTWSRTPCVNPHAKHTWQAFCAADGLVPAATSRYRDTWTATRIGMLETHTATLSPIRLEDLFGNSARYSILELATRGLQRGLASEMQNIKPQGAPLAARQLLSCCFLIVPPTLGSDCFSVTSRTRPPRLKTRAEARLAEWHFICWVRCRNACLQPTTWVVSSMVCGYTALGIDVVTKEGWAAEAG